jgi:D-alanyl-D-alanine carboxypeptidase/D-alanyl-D-alanine-endopeptidase (penicillin-binding protein 4)
MEPAAFPRILSLALALVACDAPVIAEPETRPALPSALLEPVSDPAPRLVDPGAPVLFGTEEDAARDGGFPDGQLRFVVLERVSGRVLRSLYADGLSIPASVTKLPTALRVSDKLGLDARPQTSVLQSSSGRLYLRGGGDIALSVLDLQALAASVAASAKRPVSALVLDDTLFARKPLVSSGFDPLGSDNPGIGALALANNVFPVRVQKTDTSFTILGEMSLSFRVVRSDDVGARAELLTRSSSASGDLWRLNSARVTAILADKPVGHVETLDEVPVRDPGLFAAELFREFLAREGLPVPAPQRGSTPSSAATVAVHEGGELRALLRRMLEVSDNASAETLALLAQSTISEKPSMERAATGLNQWLQNLEPSIDWGGLRLLNSSGLTTSNLVTPRQMASALRAAMDRPDLAPVFDLLNRSENGIALLRAKTGSLNYVRALAGSLRTRNGTDTVFAIFINDRASRSALDRGPGAPDYGRAVDGVSDWNARSLKLRQELVNLWSQTL